MPGAATQPVSRTSEVLVGVPAKLEGFVEEMLLTRSLIEGDGTGMRMCHSIYSLKAGEGSGLAGACGAPLSQVRAPAIMYKW